MICVPEATMLPSVPRPMRRSNSRMASSGNPAGNVGKARSSRSPISSQWPVTESLPGETSAIRPNAASGAWPAAGPRAETTREMPSACRFGMRSGTCAAMLPRVLLPSSP